MQVQTLGHVVLKVRSLRRAEGFYAGTLGLRIVMRLTEPPMTFFALDSSTNHHDFALIELGHVAPSAPGDATGLAHVAFKVGGSPGEYDAARRVVEASGIPVLYEAERGFAKSLHVLDPDGNEIELYVQTSAA